MRENLPAPLSRRPSYLQQNNGNPFTALRQEMDRLFDDFFTPSASFGSFAFTPAIDVSETDKDVRVRTELPGVAESDVDIELNGDLLTIKGEKREEKSENGENRRVFERSYGAFQRSIRLPFEPKEDQVKAAFKDGVLTVTAPKPPELAKASKRIPIARN
jgi:HSP20 family protein